MMLRIILLSSDVLVHRDGRGGVIRRFLLIQDHILLPVRKDLLNGLVTVILQNQPQTAGLDKTLLPHPLSECQDTLTRFVCLLRISAGFYNA